ncbi:DEAD/DEAH box helicase [Fusobacterium canifelinum]|uniref:DEAD/DEAH box helicase n=1 Tax=Fusobacterium canifelinum TaxID=285729 RepID=A0A3P1V300_9FUSO|nr:DEAD/DEAH box helicase [Fusobacterium canifelinum]RRD28471.1 DEAD/DEAH box helicase [Fusobacterium canifelinum]
MKIDLLDIETQYINNRNLNYAKKHYIELKYGIIRLEINYIDKIDSTFIEMESIVAGYENETSLTINNEGNYEYSSCTCGFHNSTEPCGHVWQLAKYVIDNDLEAPYEYEKDEDKEETVEKFFEKRNKIVQETINNEWFKEILKEDIIDKLSKIETSSLNLVPSIEFDELHSSRNFPKIKFKIGRDKLYTIRDIYSQIITAIKNKEFKNFGKELKVSMYYDTFTDFSKKQLDFIIKYPNNINQSKKNMIDLNENNMDDFYNTYFDSPYGEIIFQEEDFKTELIIEKNDIDYEIYLKNKFYNPKEKKKERIQDKSDWRSYRFNYELPFTTKNFIVTKNRIYKYDKKSKIFLYMNINEYEMKLFYKLARESLILSEDKFFEVFSFFQDKLEHFNISEEYLDLIKNYLNKKPKIYLDINSDGYLIFKLEYKNHFVNTNLIQIVEIFEMLNPNIIENLKNYINFYQKVYEINETMIIEKKSEIDKFIEDIIPLLHSYADIYLSQSIKNFNKTRKINYSVGVKVASNFLELDFSSTDLDKGEIIDILNQYRAKKKYYRLKKGEIILMDQEQLEFLDDFIKDFNIKDADLKKGNIKIPNFRAHQLNALQNKYMNIEKNQDFNKLFEQKIEEIPAKYKKILREYQIVGVEWMLKLRSMNLGGILADDMGLGKTLQVIAYLESIERERPCLIITPASLILNWENEFNKFNSSVSILSIYGDRKNREELLTNLKNEVVITSYDYLKRDTDLYDDIEFDTIILDEAQYIKNHKTKVAQAVKKINSKFKLALTGTPLENSLAEIWSIFDFLMNGYLFNYDYFYKNYERAIVLQGEKNVTERLKNMVEPFILRRLKKDVLRELPEKIEETYFIEMNQEEKNLYQANLVKINETLVQNIDVNTNKIEVLAMLTKLRQICIDPRLLYEDISSSSSKINACIELIEKSIENKQRILLFSSFTTVLDLVAQECDNLSIPYFMLTGETNKVKRNQLVEDFQNDAVPLFLISLKAGGTGLNLTKASVVIHLDPWWNISAQNQATDRAHRIGQEDTVQVFSLITKNTIEEKILNLQNKKKELSDIFVENSKGSFSSLTKEELLDLFRLE